MKRFHPTRTDRAAPRLARTTGRNVVTLVAYILLSHLASGRAPADDFDSPFPTAPGQPGGVTPGAGQGQGQPQLSDDDLSLDTPIPGRLIGEAAMPRWIKEGMRITYRFTKADDQGRRSVYIVQADINAVTPENVAGVNLMWQDIDGNQSWVLMKSMGFVSAPGGEAEGFWLAPPLIAAVAESLSTKEAKASGHAVKEDTIMVENQNYDVITIDRRTSTGAVVTSYEKKTGVVVETSVYTMVENEWILQSTFELLTVRRRELPWIMGRPPAWALKMKSLQYQGQMIYAPEGDQPLQMPAGLTAQTTQVGRNWVSMSSTVMLNGRKQSESSVVSAVSQYGGFFLPPLDIQKLRQGQQLDRDPVTGATLRVLFVGKAQNGRDVVTIEQQTRGFRRVTDYELSTGILLLATQQIPAFNQTFQFYFSGIE